MAHPTLLAAGYRRPKPNDDWYQLPGIPAATAAWRAKGAASYAASKVNLPNPGTYDCTPGEVGSDPSWDAATGWTFDGTQWLDTGLTVNPTSGNQWTCLIRFDSCPQGNGDQCAMGAWDAYHSVYLMPRYNTDTQRRYASNAYSTQFLDVSGALSSGIMGISATAPNSATAYLDGVSDGAMTGTFPGAATRTQAIGGMHDFQPIRNFFVGNVVAAIWWLTALTPEQIATVTAAMETL